MPPVRIRHGVRTVWDVPAHVAAQLTPHVRRCTVLVPTWCHELTIRWCPDPNDEDPAALMRVHWAVEYRSAEFLVYPPYMAVDTEERWRTVLHEFCHLPMCGVYSAFYRCSASLGGELEEVYNETFRRELEGSTQDFARAIQQLIEPPALVDRAP
jgi:hypothetical protein